MQKQQAMMVKNLCPGLMELGKIKIGNKGAVRTTGEGKEWQAPQKLDHFLITTMQRGADNNFVIDERLHKLLAPAEDRQIRSIPIRLIYDDIPLNFATRYICYYGKTVFCSGDGEEAQRLQPDKKTYSPRTCPCERQDPKFPGDDGKGKGKCKINGILSVIIDGAQSVGGVWKFRTTSYNSVVGILSSLALIQRITGGRLAGIPLNMTITPKTVQDPIQNSQQTVYVVGLQYAGTIDTLRDTGYQIAMIEAKHGISMQRIEEDARALLTHTPTSGLGDDTADDVVAEFYPEEAAAELLPPEVVTGPLPVEAQPEVQVQDEAPPLADISAEQEPQAATTPPPPAPEKKKQQRQAKQQAVVPAEPPPVEEPPVSEEPTREEQLPPVEVEAEEEIGDLF